MPGLFVAFVDNIDNALTFEILKTDLHILLNKRVLLSVVDASHEKSHLHYEALCK
jgi:hypothetical protein